MEAEAQTQALCPPVVRSSEGLRQRQRDRLSPRGRFATLNTIPTTITQVERQQNYKVPSLSAPKPRVTGKRSPNKQKNLMQESSRNDNNVFRRVKREAEDVKGSITPDGGSAGREGRQFTVAKVGNGGKIYLRPSIRPANQRYAQPSFVFPTTPPDTAGPDAAAFRREEDLSQRESLWSRSKSASSLTQRIQCVAPTKIRRERAHSYSTVDDQHAPVTDKDVGAFKVIIERPGTGTATQKLDFFRGTPALDINIPSYKLGKPRFSMRGTPFLRGSSCTTNNDDVRSSAFSSRETSQMDPASQHHTRILSRRHSDASPQSPAVTGPPSSDDQSRPMPSPRIVKPSRAIEPEMFDALTFKPACDHPSIVRYGESGSIRAATPARLVAEITSPTFVDYDLLSDFFLTFRSFLETTDLLLMLIARLQWAVARDDEIGTVVRVRTFVAIRHWVLNYFLDDYVIDYELRVLFCERLNAFAHTLLEGEMHTKVPLKIVEELKKCWRRVCALYWDGPDFDPDLGVEVPIVPGGVAGSRDPTLDQAFWEMPPAGPPRLDGIIEPDFIENDTSVIEGRNFFADVSRAGHIDSVVVFNPTPPNTREDGDHLQRPLSPTSIVSEDFVSCSFPSRSRGGGTINPLGAHPVPASSIYDPAPPVATTPKALTGKRARPSHSHKRSESFSDSLRDRRAQPESAPPVQKVIYKSTELLLALPYAGSLVRGNLFPPGQAFVDFVAPSTPAEFGRETTLFPRPPPNPKGPSAMSGPGMKRLLGGVRRALSTKAGHSPAGSPTQGSFPNIPPLGVRGATINRLPGTAVVPQARRHDSIHAPMRIDLLGAEIAEDFKRAVREEEEADEARKSCTVEQQSLPRSSHRESAIQYSTMCPDVTLENSSPITYRSPKSEVTNGSNSIVIIDDTMTLSLPMMTGALAASPSVGSFADSFLHPLHGPTPPTTPPGIPFAGTPRRSSHLLGHTVNRSLSLEGLPSLIGDSQPSREYECPLGPRPIPTHSMRLHSQTYRVRKSVSLRRCASFHSGFNQHRRSERSFDATTFTEEQSIADSFSPNAPIQAPLRVLRRRPGGDLRAVGNVGDLNNANPRPMSTGSLTTYSDSVRSSYLLGSGDDSRYVDVVNSDYDESQARVETFSLGALAEAAPKARVSLFDTHSSQPVMRPSFEKEAQMLAQIPDDTDDDGGVESALLKLEGKFEQRRSELSSGEFSRRFYNGGNTNSFGGSPYDVSTLTLDDDEEEKRRYRQRKVVDSSIFNPTSTTYQPQQASTSAEHRLTVYQPTGMTRTLSVPGSSGLTDSFIEGSFLDGAFSEDGSYRRHTRNWSERSILEGPGEGHQRTMDNTPHSSHPGSFDFITETESLRRMRLGARDCVRDSGNHSFLNIDSDLSSEMSVISKADYTEEMSNIVAFTFPPLGPGAVIRESPHPSKSARHPPSPPITLVQALNMSPSTANIPQVHDYQLEHENQLPPTPGVTPTTAPAVNGFDRGVLRPDGISEASRKTSVHLPFILAFDSRVLAQQFTLIEKDALNEIDWKDLIEMRWRDAATDTRSWVEFLRSSEPRGVEVVIARFNIMVKWAVSEIVLTADLEERVRCIIKFIHIAVHCRKYRNFATMTQLTVALTSKDISRLTSTWAHIPASDIQTLNELEELVTPTSNFHNLRAEMEGSGADQGCIPFVGIYTHDLIINSERPSQFASTPTTEPLVNFERCRCDSTIIKNILRLIEASQLYRFLPIEGITERCLWMAALRDEDIAKFGKSIQN
ncbi:Guanine nucleotide exchange factor lte1 [Ciborinia camelliae]|nr:Guanine nucleotide exchange factor lte1 [Ciborinia camelliae]